MRQARLGPGSYLLFLLWTLLLVALLPPDGRLWLVLASVVLLGMLGNRGGLRLAGRPRFWFFLLSIVVISPFVLGEPDLFWGRVGMSRAGLAAGLGMALRAAVLMLAFGTTLGALTISQLMALFERAGLRGLGFALGVAVNLTTALQEVVAAAYHTIRLRGGWRRPIQNTPLFLVTVIANALRYGDDVVKSAAARAFDPNASLAPRGRHGASPWDRLFAAGLAVVAACLLVPIWFG